MSTSVATPERERTMTLRPTEAHKRIALVAVLAGVGVLIFLVCASTVPLSLELLYAGVAAYLLCSVVWAVVQFWFDDVSAARAGWIGTVLVAAGVIAFAVWFGSRLDPLPLIGAALLYAGFGWWVEWLRRAHRIPTEGVWLLLGSVVVAGAAGFGLSHASGVWFTVLVGVFALAALIGAPIGLNLASESLLWRLAGPAPVAITIPGRTALRMDSRRATVGALAIGAAIPLTAIIAEISLGHSWTPVLVAAGIALLLLAAIASDTHLDTAIVIAALALVAAAPPNQDPPRNLSAGTGSSALVALGDSYMSGEGAAEFYAGTDDGGGNECRRAPTAYAALEAGPGTPFDAVTFLACSGARTYNVTATGPAAVTGVQRGEGGTQVDQLKEILASHPGFTPKMVIVSLGGNDAGFATLGETCLLPGNCDVKRALFEKNLPAVHDALVTAYASIRSVLPASVPVVAVPYPQPIASGIGSCEGFPLSRSERVFIDSFVDELNTTVHQAADEEGLHYLAPMKNALASEHLQLCDPLNHGAPGIRPVTVESVSGLASQRFNPVEWLHNSLHPNERGHRAMFNTFNAWLKANPALTPTTPSPAPVSPGATGVPKPPCSFSAVGEANCQTQARTWELQQVVDLWPWLFAIIPALGGLWLFAVASLSLRRRELIRAGKLAVPQ